MIGANAGAGISGVDLDGDSADELVRIVGNWIGTDPTGQRDVGNGGPGITLAGSDFVQIGGPGMAGNLIAYNLEAGVALSRGRQRRDR